VFKIHIYYLNENDKQKLNYCNYSVIIFIYLIDYTSMDILLIYWKLLLLLSILLLAL